MALKTYDAGRLDVSFAGIPLTEGLADGTFLTITPNAEGFSIKVGADGEVTRSRSRDRSATATLVLMQTSEANRRLSLLYAADRAATNGQGVGAFFVQDRGGETILEASKAFISDDPDVTFGPEAETREWTFILADYTPNHGGNPDE